MIGLLISNCSAAVQSLSQSDGEDQLKLKSTIPEQFHCMLIELSFNIYLGMKWKFKEK